MKRLSLLTAAFICVALPASAEEARRELGPHQHGHGRLNIAIEASRVAMELEVPGNDIVGFEHEPNTPEQKAAMEKAIDLLADGLSLFKLPAAAGCKLMNAKISLGAEHGDDHHDHAGKAEEKHEDAEHEHSEFRVEYALECSAVSSLTSITFDYFKAFPGAEELDVAIISPKGQTSYEVTRKEPNLDLKGIM
jgi:hypothetical protein